MTDDKLPAGAHAKLFALKDQEQQALTVVTANQRQISELQRAIDINPHGDKAGAWNKEVERLQELQPRHQSRYRALADLNARIEHFLVTLPVDVEIEDAKKVKSKLTVGETHRQAVDRIRGEIAGLIADRTNVQLAGLPVDEIKAQAKMWITKRGMNGRPTITATHEKFDVKFSYMDSTAYAPTIDTLPLLAWFDPEYLETKLNQLIDEMPKPKLALTPAEKAERLASIKAELFEVERRECAHIEAAQDEGTIIAHRQNVDPQALLGFVVSRSKAHAA